jgi:hypothetical protein
MMIDVATPLGLLGEKKKYIKISLKAMQQSTQQ